jgi:hypothetical protein
MSDTEQQSKLETAMNRFHARFGYYPFFDGMADSDMLSDTFINKLEQAVDSGDPEVDLNDFFPDGRNL